MVLTTVDLRAIDPDDTAGNLTFMPSAATNGHVALINDPHTVITSFTEAQLEAGQVIFVHDGSATTSANFSVSVKDASGLASAPATVSAAVTSVSSAFWGEAKPVPVLPGSHISGALGVTYGAFAFGMIEYAHAQNYNPDNPTGPYDLTKSFQAFDWFMLPTRAKSKTSKQIM